MKSLARILGFLSTILLLSLLPHSSFANKRCIETVETVGEQQPPAHPQREISEDIHRNDRQQFDALVQSFPWLANAAFRNLWNSKGVREQYGDAALDRVEIQPIHEAMTGWPKPPALNSHFFTTEVYYEGQAVLRDGRTVPLQVWVYQQHFSREAYPPEIYPTGPVRHSVINYSIPWEGVVRFVFNVDNSARVNRVFLSPQGEVITPPESYPGAYPD